MKRFIAIAIAIIAAIGCAFGSFPKDTGNIASIRVVTENNGEEIRIGNRDGNTFFAAPIGTEYTLRITNHSRGRILVVPTVDGLNVIDRSRGNWDGTGYVIESHGHVDVPGFRRKDRFQYVERFTFNEADFSLAKRIGNVNNVGVIGAAVFNEYVPEPVYYDAISCKESSFNRSAGEKSKCMEAPRAGTEAGRTVNDPVRRVSFTRATNVPAEILAIYYDTEDNLIAEGILPPPFDPPPTGFLSPFPVNYATGR